MTLSAISLPLFPQAQLLLADQIWPHGLFPGDMDPDKPQKHHRGSFRKPSSNLDSGETGEGAGRSVVR